MNDDGKTIVECWRDRIRIASNEFTAPATAAGPGLPLSRQEAIKRAHEGLSTERLAGPPFHGIRFDIRFERP
jgi:hypothetical protein